MRATASVLIVCGSLVAAGCGQKGALYLPDKNASVVTRPAGANTAAPPAETTPANTTPAAPTPGEAPPQQTPQEKAPEPPPSPTSQGAPPKKPQDKSKDDSQSGNPTTPRT